MDQSELEKRKQAALAAIKAAYGTEEDEFGATLFVSHHLEQLDPTYWLEYFQTEKPEPMKILDSLVLQMDFEENDEEEDEEALDMLDFTLPGEATNYLLSVSFDEDGQVEEISMES